jgi:hypothetical protein
VTLDIQSEVVDDLNYLEEHGALAGVAEVIRERRWQIEQLGYDADHDSGCHADGGLVHHAAVQLGFAQVERVSGTADPASDESRMRKAGALAAAEIDRLGRLLAPDDPRGKDPS